MTHACGVRRRSGRSSGRGRISATRVPRRRTISSFGPPTYWNRLPAHLQTPEMKDAVNEWHDYRTRRKILLTRESMARQINTLAPLSPDQAVVWIQTAIDQNWRGMYPPPNGNGYARQESNTKRKQDTQAKEFKSNVSPRIIT